MADDSNDKTEQATDQKREEFRKRGQVAQSKEVAIFMTLFGVVLTIWGMSKMLMGQLTELFTKFFGGYVLTAARNGDYSDATLFALKTAGIIISPVLFVVFILSFFSSLFQVGFLYNEEAMQFKLDRINPLNGAKRLFSLRAVVDGAKATAKVGVIAYIVFLIIRDEIQHINVLVDYNVTQLLVYFGTISFKLASSVCLFIALLAVIDYAYQKWEMEKQMRMSKQEIKEENKNKEGDPLIKARIRRVQREMASKRMMADIPKADMIITNPTHIAVALKYEAGMPAPILLAKGADLVAEKIKKIARENNIPVIENKPLARAIYKTLKIGQWIPRELFKAVAEVLAYVYRLKKKRKV